MPLYDYSCRSGHTFERLLRGVARADVIVACPHCGEPAARVFPIPHVEVDGIYSHSPNLGTEEEYERKRHALREGIHGYLRD